MANKQLRVKIRDYVDADGNTKGHWMKVGSLIEKEGKQPFILLDRAFNPAGVVSDAERDSVMISVFED